VARISPIIALHQQTNAVLSTYGPSEAGVQVVATYGELELEYAALRKQCVLMDLPQRAVVEVTGPDRLDFLNRMITQELKGMPLNTVRRSFWLNRKGRIDADLRVINLPDRVLLEMDVHAAARTIEGLGAFVITEDVVIRDMTESTHRLAIHGPTALRAMQTLQDLAGLEADRSTSHTFENAPVVVFREDTTGDPGYEIIVPSEIATRLYQRLIEVGHDPDHGAAALRHNSGALAQTIRLRPSGWHAYNIARIEAGTPLYNIDFGENSLPAETGVLDDRVSFKKGCYLGQEVVARMHSRGHSKQVLVGIKFDVMQSPDDFVLQPTDGAELIPVVDGKPGPEPVGAITSSTISPMLGSAAIAFAQIKQSHRAAGTQVAAQVSGRTISGEVQPSLAFWRRSTT
jgi:folate-binding protein YgfZ